LIRAQLTKSDLLINLLINIQSTFKYIN